MEPSLWGLGEGKTLAVIEYLRKLEAPGRAYFNHAKFESMVKEALAMDTPNKALEHIGYRYGTYPLIFDDCTGAM